METSLKTGFAQIFSCCPKNPSCPNFGGAAAPLAPPGPYAYDYRLFTLFDQSLQFSFGQKINKCRGYLEFLIEDKIWLRYFAAITVALVQGETAGCHVLVSTITICAANRISGRVQIRWPVLYCFGSGAP